jgi:hypothetical protein
MFFVPIDELQDTQMGLRLFNFNSPPLCSDIICPQEKFICVISVNLQHKHKCLPFGNQDYYSPKYEKALLHGDLCEHEGCYLSRIPKKNNKHRYYITYRMEDVLETEYFDRPCNIYMYEYRSAYVGKDLETALLTLYYTQENVFG